MARRLIMMLVLILNMLILTTAAQAVVVINEVMPTPSAGDDWIELYNDDMVDLSLDGWRIDDSSSTIRSFVAGDVVAAGGYMIVEVGSRLNRDGDSLHLWDADDWGVDKLSYGDV